MTAQDRTPEPTAPAGHPSGLLLGVERLPAASDRDATSGRLTDNDGNDK
jgi:hypothetical protein